MTSYREGDAVPVVRRFSQATFLAITNGRQLVTDLREIREVLAALDAFGERAAA